ncbi:Protein of unknown function [Gryllus bimaculatus]|nr:Protein of unknown function [Gryllus bimaculatus]
MKSLIRWNGEWAFSHAYFLLLLQLDRIGSYIRPLLESPSLKKARGRDSRWVSAKSWDLQKSRSPKWEENVKKGVLYNAFVLDNVAGCDVQG